MDLDGIKRLVTFLNMSGESRLTCVSHSLMTIRSSLRQRIPDTYAQLLFHKALQQHKTHLMRSKVRLCSPIVEIVMKVAIADPKFE